MTRISCLSEEVARQIAAGEVVERPASVVKELVENALDAGASTITVLIENAGTSLVEVRDNGCGMSREDLILAPMNFSTSKITEAEDLNRVSTYGFRGEALASISAVSRMKICSSDNSEGEGWCLSLQEEGKVDPVPAPREKGTTVQVRDLFFNTPARKKFLKTHATEKRKILDTILSYAMIQPQLELHFIDQGKHVLDFLPTDAWKERISIILGATSMKHMVQIKLNHPFIKGEGFTSLPTFTRGYRGYQFYYVNGRLVRERTIIHAVNEAYRGVIPSKRFPVTVLALRVPFEDVDVNVHPSKLEVRIRNAHAVHESVRRAVKTSLSSSSEPDLEVHYSPAHRANGKEDSIQIELPENPGGSLFEKEAVREGSKQETQVPGQSQAKIISLQERIREAYETFLKSRFDRTDLTPHLALRDEEQKGKLEGTPSAASEKSYGEEDLFWQFNNTYIFIQVHGGLVIIDQHAAHERVIFDTSRKNLQNAVTVSQQLLFPINIELSLSELEVLHSYQEIFEKLGFVIEPFGGKSILVRGYPQGLRNWNEGKLLLEIFDDIVQDKSPGETHIDKILASFACRSAIKAGQKLTGEQMKLLADQLFAVDNPYSCPHGRPTIQRLSISQIDNWFLR